MQRRRRNIFLASAIIAFIIPFCSWLLFPPLNDNDILQLLLSAGALVFFPPFLAGVCALRFGCRYLYPAATLGLWTAHGLLGDYKSRGSWPMSEGDIIGFHVFFAILLVLAFPYGMFCDYLAAKFSDKTPKPPKKQSKPKWYSLENTTLRHALVIGLASNPAGWILVFLAFLFVLPSLLKAGFSREERPGEMPAKNEILARNEVLAKSKATEDDDLEIIGEGTNCRNCGRSLHGKAMNEYIAEYFCDHICMKSFEKKNLH